jgi:antitoxin component YwqK of YwqJK toxin-antitoxin module
MLKEIKTNTQHYFVDENGDLQGEYKSYYDNDQLWEHAFFQNGKHHGEYKRYHDNGQLWVHSFYLNGKLHGEFKLYHDNGQMYQHALYQNDKFHGEFKRYHDDGKLDYATFFYQGNNINVNPDSLTEQDKTYIMLSGRLPPRD